MYAGFWKRLAAYLIDSIIIGIVLAFPMTFISSLMTGFFVVAFEDDDPAALIPAAFIVILSSLAIIIAQWLYYAIMESSKVQGTVGKMLLNLQVVDLEGNPLSFAKATGRYFGKIISQIFYIGYIMIAFTEKKQGLHDMFVESLVVNKTPVYAHKE